MASQIATSTNIINKSVQSTITRDLPVGDLMNAGETISTINSFSVLLDESVVSGGGHLAISTAIISGTNIRFTMSGGIADTVYRAYVQFTTSTSDIIEAAGRVFVGKV